jgi:hypothetical protein
MAESTMPTTTAILAPSTTITVTATGTSIEPKIRMVVTSPNGQSYRTQLLQVIHMNLGCAGGRGGVEGGCGVSAYTTKRKSRQWNLPLSIQQWSTNDGADGSAQANRSYNEHM